MTESGGTLPEVQAAALRGEPLVRYEVLAEIGSGGMATVQYGRLHAPRGFSRSVAIKRLHPQFAKDPEFVAMFIDEARLSARLVHANIVGTLDVIDAPGELALVMEYVHGESLWNLLRLSNQYAKPVPLRVATALTASVLHGLQAAHDACDEVGQPLGIVHRDVSPHNILVGGDGIPRIIDFGVAKAVGRLRSTPSGEIKGKLIYMSPEQLSAGPVDPRADVYGAAAVLWETLTGLSLFDGPNESAIMHGVLLGTIDPPGKHRREVTQALDAIVMRGLSRESEARFETAREMALALEHDVGIASQSEIAGWLQDLAGGRLAERSRLIAELHERSSPHSRSEPRLTRPGETAGPVEASAADGGTTARTDRRDYRIWLAALALLVGSGAFWLYARDERVLVHAAPASKVAPPVGVEPVQTADGASTVTSAITDSDLPHGVEPPVGERERSKPARELRRARGGKTSEETPKASNPNRPDCRSWFYIDETGIRRPKPDCL